MKRALMMLKRKSRIGVRLFSDGNGRGMSLMEAYNTASSSHCRGEGNREL